jgi:hypothetical protein
VPRVHITAWEGPGTLRDLLAEHAWHVAGRNTQLSGTTIHAAPSAEFARG